MDPPENEEHEESEEHEEPEEPQPPEQAGLPAQAGGETWHVPVAMHVEALDDTMRGDFLLDEEPGQRC